MPAFPCPVCRETIQVTIQNNAFRCPACGREFEIYLKEGKVRARLKKAAPGAAPKPKPDRQRGLEQEIARYTSQGYRLLSQQGGEAVLEKPKKINTKLLIVSILLGFWLYYLLYYLLLKSERVILRANLAGEVLAERQENGHKKALTVSLAVLAVVSLLSIGSIVLMYSQIRSQLDAFGRSETTTNGIIQVGATEAAESAPLDVPQDASLEQQAETESVAYEPFDAAQAPYEGDTILAIEEADGLQGGDALSQTGGLAVEAARGSLESLGCALDGEPDNVSVMLEPVTVTYTGFCEQGVVVLKGRETQVAEIVYWHDPSSDLRWTSQFFEAFITALGFDPGTGREAGEATGRVLAEAASNPAASETLTAGGATLTIGYYESTRGLYLHILP